MSNSNNPEQQNAIMREALLRAATSKPALAEHLRERSKETGVRVRNTIDNSVGQGPKQVTISFPKQHNPEAPMVRNALSEQVVMTFTIDETEDHVTFTVDPEKGIDIESEGKLFNVLRGALSSSKGAQYFLMIKFAARVTEVPYPCIQDPATLTLYLDPLMAFRNPLVQFKHTGTITLLKMPSDYGYYRVLERKNKHARKPTPPKASSEGA